MGVASVRVFGAQPEEAAWKKLAAWAGPKGLLDDPAGHPVFGFSNPNPTSGQTEYGYDLWIKIGNGVDAGGEIEIRDFEGGQYAVVTAPSLDSIRETYKELWEWILASPEYSWRKTHELERVHNHLAPTEEMVIGIYVPIQPA